MIRTCDVCFRPMMKGYCIDSGASYYCGDRCLHNDFTHEEIMELDLGGDESDNYWTEWEDEFTDDEEEE